MDPSIFQRSRGRLLTWLFLPPVLIAATHCGAHIASRQMLQSFRVRAAAIDRVPSLIRAVRAADKAVAMFQEPGAPSASPEEHSGLLYDAARRAEVTINELSFELDSAATAPGMCVYRASVRGDGNIAEVVRFFDELMRTNRLIVPETVQLRRTRVGPETLYDLELAFRWNVPGDPAGKRPQRDGRP